MNPPTCSRCDEPCVEIYSVEKGRRRWDAPMGFAETFYHDDPRIIWLCADCVDEVAEAMA